ncbi:MAG: hypothetical protein ACLUVY_05545 [Bacteroides uniformis]
MNHLLRICGLWFFRWMAALTAVAISGSFIQPWLVADWDDARAATGEAPALSEAGTD